MTTKSLRSLLVLLAFAVVFAMPAAALAADPHGPDAAHLAHDPAGTAAPVKHTLPLYAVPIFYGIGGHPPVDPHHPETAKIGLFAITNSMILTWIVALVIVGFAQYATRSIKQLPDGAQNFWEWLVEGLYRFLEGVIGHDLVRKTFWFFATVFIFILFTNWFGLIPGVGTVGWGHPSGPLSVDHVTRPLLRGANADLNMTLAMAIIFFICWVVWALKANGPGGFILHIFGPKGDTTGFVKAIMIVVFLVVGVLEVVSILFRPVSLSFRLFGNIYAGESMLEAMATLIQNPPWLRAIASTLIPVPFYFMELLVGLVQALVFMLLTAVFTLLICQHDDKPHDPAHH